MKNKYHTIGTVPTFNRKIVEMKWKTKKYPNVEPVRKVKKSHIKSSKVKVVTVDMLVTSSCTVTRGYYSHNVEYPNIYALP